MALLSGLFFIVGIIIIFVLLLGVSLLSGIFRFIFGTKRKSPFDGARSYGAGTNSNNQGRRGGQSINEESNESHHKVFGSDEGDYVEFEEVDDN